jgi:hypothetical protein
VEAPIDGGQEGGVAEHCERGGPQPAEFQSSLLTGLAEKANEKVGANFLVMRVGQDQAHAATNHEFMPPTCERPFESEPMQTLNQLAPAHRGKPCNTGRGNSMTTLPSGGMGSPR